MHQCKTFPATHSSVLDLADLQSLTKAAFDEEEADRNAAVAEVVTALTGDTEGAAAESLRIEIEGLINDLRVEVAEAAAQDYDAKQAEQVSEYVIHFHDIAIAMLWCVICSCKASCWCPLRT